MQLGAKRQNAQKSAGPETPEGKAIVAWNPSSTDSSRSWRCSPALSARRIGRTTTAAGDDRPGPRRPHGGDPGRARGRGHVAPRPAGGSPPELRPDSGRFRPMVEAWRRLPLWMARGLEPWTIGRLSWRPRSSVLLAWFSSVSGQVHGHGLGSDPSCDGPTIPARFGRRAAGSASAAAPDPPPRKRSCRRRRTAPHCS